MNWRHWGSSLRCQDGIPSWVGLSLTGLYLAIVLCLGAVSMWSSRAQTLVAEREDLARWVSWLGRYVELAFTDDDPALLARELRRAGRELGIHRCEIVSRQGQVVASSDAARIGQFVADDTAASLPGISNTRAQPLNREDQHAATAYAVRLRRSPIALTSATQPARDGAPDIEDPEPEEVAAAVASGIPAPTVPQWLVVESSGTGSQWSALSWWTSVGYVVLAGLAVLWMLYRLILRAVRPMAAIQQRLLTADGRLEEQLALLRINDTMDQTASAWNRLVEFIREMHEELRSVQLRTAVDSTLNAYRSERLAGVLRQMPHGVLVVEENGQISFANKAAGRMLGRDEDLVGADVKDIFPEPLRASVLGAGRSVSRWIDHAVDGPDGSTTVRFTAVPFEKDAQAPTSIVFMQDVSQFKEVERARDAFLYHVTHELRTPLTNIRAYAETLSGGVLDDEASLRECYNVISGETERLGRLVEDILNVSQLEVGTARLSFGEVYVDRLIRDAVQDIQAHADAKGVDLRLHLPAKLPPIRGDKERLSVVAANLLGNAIKYTPSGGHVELTCELEGSGRQDAAGGLLKVSVSDTGIGIAPEHHERIFEKFYRVSDERVDAQPGTGLGLAIVKETVRLHGGSVTVESTPGRGSTFHVTLPVTAT